MTALRFQALRGRMRALSAAWLFRSFSRFARGMVLLLCTPCLAVLWSGCSLRVGSVGAGASFTFHKTLEPVSYTHLTLPTNREV